MAGHRQIGTNLDPSGAVAFGAEPAPRRRRHNAGRPNNGAYWNKFVAEAHALATAVGDSYPEANFDAKLLERTSRGIR
jgi:hypothetical protein